jgi:transcriptional regulator with PAS, ATPase and Fis domain
MKKAQNEQAVTQEEISLLKEVIKNNTMDEVAKMLGISRRSLYNYMHELGIIPFKNNKKKNLKQILQKLKK